MIIIYAVIDCIHNSDPGIFISWIFYCWIYFSVSYSLAFFCGDVSLLYFPLGSVLRSVLRLVLRSAVLL